MVATVRRRWPAKPLERGRLVLLALLALLTAGAWALTVHQARTMDMPMGVVAHGGAGPAPQPAAAPVGARGTAASDPMAGTGDMAGMGSMPGTAAAPAAEPAGSGPGAAAASGMAGMQMDEARSWDGFAAFLVAWAVMMAAMMFPAAAPMLLFYRTVAAGRRAKGGAFVPTWVFAAGYLLVWTAIGVVTWVLVQLGSELAGRGSDADRDTWAPLALGAVLVIAGLYQFTPLKGACLRQCQSPVGFVMTRWRDGLGGALRMGVVHGAYCLGCCWALFAVLVAAGVMSLAWMLLLTLVVFAEKALPAGGRTARVVGAALLLLGVLVAGGATGMPWMA